MSREAMQQALGKLRAFLDTVEICEGGTSALDEAYDNFEIVQAALAEHPEGQQKTGWPPGMLQDDSRELSKWLASKPDAREVARRAAEASDPTNIHSPFNACMYREHCKSLAEKLAEQPAAQSLGVADRKALDDALFKQPAPVLTDDTEYYGLEPWERPAHVPVATIIYPSHSPNHPFLALGDCAHLYPDAAQVKSLYAAPAAIPPGHVVVPIAALNKAVAYSEPGHARDVLQGLLPEGSALAARPGAK